jgi:plasmid stabilization system protein ParE
MRIEWTDRAVRGKQNVADYIRDRFGYKHKRKFVQEVDRTARMLMKHPNMGPVEPLLAERTQTYRSVVVGKLNKMVYYIEEDTVIYVVAFWDCRREPDTLASQVK